MPASSGTSPAVGDGRAQDRRRGRGTAEEPSIDAGQDDRAACRPARGGARWQRYRECPEADQKIRVLERNEPVTG
jgi:hypothetical protein